MKKAINLFALLLAAQLILLAGIHLSASSDSGIEVKPLLTANLDQTDTLEIKGQSGERTLLAKRDSHWVLPEADNQPVTPGKVQEILDKLKAAQVSWPVATSASAANRFELSDKSPQKTLVLSSGGQQQATLYLGTSPGYRRVHARLQGEDDIYDIALAQHEIPTVANDWLDKALLQYPGELLSVKTASFTVTRDSADESSQWALQTGADQDLAVDSTAIQTWVKRFSQLIVSERVPPEQVDAIIIQNPVLTTHMSGESGEADYAFYRHGDKTYVKRFGNTALYALASYQADPIVNVTPASFFPEQEDSSPATAEE